MKKTLLARWQANFLAGLAVVMPAALSVAVVVWLFGTVSNFTDTLLFFLPRRLTHAQGGTGPMFWYWKLIALGLAVVLIAGVGRITRHYLGRRLISWVDQVILSVPLLNKIYSVLKQVNEAFSLGKKGAFQTVVLVEFPRPGMYALGFVTGEHENEVEEVVGERAVTVFVPTTPNPTSGFLLVVPETQLRRLRMPVGDAVRFIVSVGAITPGSPAPGNATVAGISEGAQPTGTAPGPGPG
ncbi:DUF502 domain-containing protein [Limisphaera sp. VF-2]|uniref:DUF502 domain-containing protein n=1 Tax=Limisphaera sp. VF-2 TaxID=3400418 RepID=UPI00177325D2|nr:DUF502 domain-containing protein [Limisphaera sp.]